MDSSITPSRVCLKCGAEKPLGQFGKRADGYTGGYRTYCRRCENVRRDARRARIPNHRNERFRAAKRERRRRHYYLHREEELARHRAANQTPEGRARQAAAYAIKSGRLVKPDQCERCGAAGSPRDIQAHHEDYAKPLEVQWLCRICHWKADEGRRQREAEGK